MNDVEIKTLLEKGNQIKLSDEQSDILFYHMKTPLLVDACAGAGKTTTIMMSIITEALFAGLDRQPNVMGITFSHDAKDDLGLKFNLMQSRLARVNDKVLKVKQPSFYTFHALFYHLYQDLVGHKLSVTSYSDYTNDLYEVIDNPELALSRFENVEKYMKTYDTVINLGWSQNGLDFDHDDKTVKIICDQLGGNSHNDLVVILTYLGHGDIDYIKNYQNVVKKYWQLKSDNGQIDFADMQSLLLMKLQDSKMALVNVKHELKDYQRLYIDEFQDISKVQWELIKMIMPDECLNHLMVIGDDDQSIYRFRGSDPRLIMTFTDKMPNAKQFNMSVNYRTAGNILKVAANEVTINQVRLDKSLKAFHQGGEIVKYSRTNFNQDVLVGKLVNEVNDHPSESYAVLAHDNFDLILWADKLYELGIVPSLMNHPELSLSHNVVYHTYDGLITGLIKNEVGPVRNKLKQLINMNAQRAVDQVVENMNPSEVEPSLINILNEATNYVDMSADNGEMTIIKLKALANKIYAVHQENSNEKNMIEDLLRYVQDETDHYWKFMIRNGLLNMGSINFDMLSNYIQYLWRKFDSVDEFHQHEKSKQSQIVSQSKIEQAPVKLLTMHRSKGLEFDHTILYLTDQVKSGINDLGRAFGATLTLKKFKHLVNIQSDKKAFIGAVAYFNPEAGQVLGQYLVQKLDQGKSKEQISQDCKVVNYFLNLLPAPGIDSDSTGVQHSFYYDKTIKNTVKVSDDVLSELGVSKDSFDLWNTMDELGEALPTILDDNDEALRLRKYLMMQLRKGAEDIEEAHRLIYVALTRAKKTCWLDLPLEYNDCFIRDFYQDKDIKLVQNDGQVVVDNNDYHDDLHNPDGSEKDALDIWFDI